MSTVLRWGALHQCHRGRGGLWAGTCCGARAPYPQVSLLCSPGDLAWRSGCGGGWPQGPPACDIPLPLAAAPLVFVARDGHPTCSPGSPRHSVLFCAALRAPGAECPSSPCILPLAVLDTVRLSPLPSYRRGEQSAQGRWDCWGRGAGGQLRRERGVTVPSACLWSAEVTRAGLGKAGGHPRCEIEGGAHSREEQGHAHASLHHPRPDLGPGTCRKEMGAQPAPSSTSPELEPRTWARSAAWCVCVSRRAVKAAGKSQQTAVTRR